MQKRVQKIFVTTNSQKIVQPNVEKYIAKIVLQFGMIRTTISEGIVRKKNKNINNEIQHKFYQRYAVFLFQLEN